VVEQAMSSWQQVVASQRSHAVLVDAPGHVPPSAGDEPPASETPDAACDEVEPVEVELSEDCEPEPDAIDPDVLEPNVVEPEAASGDPEVPPSELAAV
jgi:hypothetical protein